MVVALKAVRRRKIPFPRLQVQLSYYYWRQQLEKHSPSGELLCMSMTGIELYLQLCKLKCSLLDLHTTRVKREEEKEIDELAA